jgi:drug/metabolite transporter (DMT)-like permease
MSKGWEIAKEALGFAGAVLMVFPWLRDFLLRLKRDWLNRLPVGGSLADARQHFAEVFSRRIDRPKTADLLVTILGIMLLAASFLIGLARALLTDGG